MAFLIQKSLIYGCNNIPAGAHMTTTLMYSVKLIITEVVILHNIINGTLIN